MKILRDSNGSFQAMNRMQNTVNGNRAMAPCAHICQPYSVPGGGTPCGSICVMYCVGK